MNPAAPRQVLDALGEQISGLNEALEALRESRDLHEQHAHRILALRLQVTQCRLRLSEPGLKLGGPVVHDGSPSSVGRTPKVGAAGDAAPSPRRSGGAA